MLTIVNVVDRMRLDGSVDLIKYYAPKDYWMVPIWRVELILFTHLHEQLK